jgi:beta-lactamase regulating signal transducer with metallopeptidase domain
MQNVLYNISQVLGITIVHSLWQGLLVYFILRIIFIAAPSLPADKKYTLSLVGIMSLFICFVYTLYIEIHNHSWLSTNSANASVLLPAKAPADSNHLINSGLSYSFINGYLPYISAVYVAGLLINGIKLIAGWNKIRQIKRLALPAEEMQQYINKLSKRLNIAQRVQIKFSELIDVPCIVGYVKPLILLPVSIASYLSACEIEAILLHELSHIKRNDYLLNLVQQVITTLLFFNPFAQLISRMINQERENGCDDVVIAKTRKPLIYAQALLKLEETRQYDLQLAMSAVGKKYNLLNRIERIMKTNKPTGNVRHLVIAVFLLTGSLGSIAWFNPGDVAAKDAAVKTTKSLKSTQPVEYPSVLPTFADEGLQKTDSNKYTQLADTSKNKHKGSIVVVDKNGNRKEYAVDGMSPEAKREFFKQNPSFDTTAFDTLAKFYSSKAWKDQMELIKKQAEDIKKQFDSPEWKAQMLAMQKQGEEMQKQFNSPQWKAQMELMKKQGEDMKKQFDSPQWKAQMELMKKQGEDMKKQFDSPQWKAQMELMKKQGEDMKKQFDTPEWKAQMENIKKQFDSPQWKAQMELMKKQGEEMQKQFNNADWKKSMKDMKWILKDSTGGTQIYMPDTAAKAKKSAQPVKKQKQ